LSTNLDLLIDPSLPFRDIAHAVQSQTSKAMVELLSYLKKMTGAKVLYYSGGVALNVVTNECIIRSGLFDCTYMNGSCEDNGTAIGAALSVYRDLADQRIPEPVTDYYGCEYPNEFVLRQLKRFPVTFEEFGDVELAHVVSDKLVEDKVIGWFQGRSEFGPRALGNRSILANPCSPSAKDALNGRVKHRESFRPYAAAVLLEKSRSYFDMDGDSPVMLRAANVNDPGLPAITHVDGASRLQTVTRADNPKFYNLIEEFGKRTGKYVVLNTSLNSVGEPIAETPENALLTFLRTDIDYLVINNFLIMKR
jgi:carbamoyltransferase